MTSEDFVLASKKILFPAPFKGNGKPAVLYLENDVREFLRLLKEDLKKAIEYNDNVETIDLQLEVLKIIEKRAGNL